LKEKLIKRRAKLADGNREKYGLIIGAGATTKTFLYCFKKLGLIPIIYNRSADKARALAKEKNGFLCLDLHTWDIESQDGETKAQMLANLDVVASSIPGSAPLEYPSNIFNNKPIIFDASYLPKITPLIDSVNQWFK
jgi:shikimate 5-dehydrogenase